MNYFLLLLIMGICGGTYYEISDLQSKSAADHRTISDQETKISELQTENKKLESDNALLTVSEKNAETALAEAKKQATQVLAANPVPPSATTKDQAAPVSPGSPSAVKKTIKTMDGKTYADCQVLKVDTDGVVVNYSGGITKILFVLMAPDVQKEFGYDATKPPQ